MVASCHYLVLPVAMAASLLLSAQAGTPTTLNWEEWKASRRESIGGTNGWSTVVGLAWLEEGTNIVGSASGSRVPLPKGRAPAVAGRLLRSGDRVEFEAAPEVEARVGGRVVTRTLLLADEPGPPTRLEIGPLALTLIRRGERLGIRTRDPGSPARAAFKGLEYFPPSDAWRLEGRFEPLTNAPPLRITDVTGATKEEKSPGSVRFLVGGREYHLAVLEDAETNDFFILFRDGTSGKSTYPTGRFLHAAHPDPSGRVWLDFNRAYNPPCAFTSYATCPLPPRVNWLPFPVEAGEKLSHLQH